MTWRDSEGLQTPLSPAETLQLRDSREQSWLPAPLPSVPKSPAPGAVIRQQLCTVCYSVGQLIFPCSCPQPIPTAARAGHKGPTPGERLHFSRSWHREFSTCFAEVFPYSSGHPATGYVKGSWCGASRAGVGQGKMESFLFLVRDALHGFPTVSIPDCWEMPRCSRLSFLLGLFR